jgi:farnesyl-diphosphate farnesyltransferase
MTGVDDLLQKTSRTFALTIPQLPPPTREEVGIAYLLFRIVDTFEDATRWSPTERMAGIRDFLPLLEEPDPVQARRFAARCADDPPVDHAGYMELLREIPFVLSCLHALPSPSRDILRAHVRRSAEGMIEVVARAGTDRVLRLSSIPELRDYCYVVAGIVGEMLTELFLLNHPRVAPARDFLRARSQLFGEALQLVNILKDAEVDAREGRIYFPEAQQAV